MPLARRLLIRRRDYREYMLSTGPAGYWVLGERGLYARDETGHHPGAYVNAPTQGVPGLLVGDPAAAVTFAAASVQSMKTGAPATTVVDNWTLAVWFRATASTGGYRTLIYNGSGFSNGYGLYLTATNTYLAQFQSVGSALLSATVAGTGAIIFAVLERRAGTTYLYLNDVLDTTGNTATPLTPTICTSVGAGSDNSNPMDGTEGHPAIWDRALSAGERTALYRIGRGY